MAERRPDLAREHRLHDRFRGPPRASPVRFQVSRPADRTSRGVPLSRIADAASQGRPPDGSGLKRESERSTSNGRAKTLCGVVVVVVVAATRTTSGRLPRIPGSTARSLRRRETAGSCGIGGHLRGGVSAWKSAAGVGSVSCSSAVADPVSDDRPDAYISGAVRLGYP